MIRTLIVAASVAVLALVSHFAIADNPAEHLRNQTECIWDPVAEQEAIRLLEERHMSYEQDESLPGKPVVSVLLCGDINGRLLAALERLPRLRCVSFKGKEITDQATIELSRLKSVNSLFFYNCGITDVTVVRIANLPHLRRLEICSAPLTDKSVKELARCRNLIELWLYDTQIGDEELEGLANLPHLQFLILYSTLVTDKGAAKLAKSKTLSELHLSSTGVGDEAVKSLASLKTLKILGLRNTSLTNTGLTELAKLNTVQELNLRENKIDYDGLMALVRMPRLTKLDISRSDDLTEAGMSRLIAALPKCEIRMFLCAGR
jgi:hypothetical protein